MTRSGRRGPTKFRSISRSIFQWGMFEGIAIDAFDRSRPSLPRHDDNVVGSTLSRVVLLVWLWCNYSSLFRGDESTVRENRALWRRWAVAESAPRRNSMVTPSKPWRREFCSGMVAMAGVPAWASSRRRDRMVRRSHRLHGHLPLHGLFYRTITCSRPGPRPM